MAASLPLRQRHIGTGATGPPPTTVARTCPALSAQGKPCYIRLGLPHHQFCSFHHGEFKDLYEQYKKLDARYETLPAGTCGPEAELRDKLECGKAVIKLRDIVNHRFFNIHTNNRGHIQRILRLQSEVNALEAALETTPTSAGTEPSAESDEPGAGKPPLLNDSGLKIYKSYLALDVPMSGLDHLPRDHPAVRLKPFFTKMANSQISKLYEVMPALNDQASQEQLPRKFDARDQVIRFVFRHYIARKADTLSLYIASRVDHFHEFIRHTVSDVSDYIKFFETLGRCDTLLFFRDAMCDHLLQSETPAPETMRILGAEITTSHSDRKMPIEGWDLLYQYFADAVDWANLEKFCFTFQDLCLVKKLVAFGRYGKVQDKTPGWLDQERDVSQESPLAVMLGLVPVTKGYSDPPLPPMSIKNDVQTEKQSRCYLVARMSKSDPNAELLNIELVKRVCRYIVLVYDYSEPHGSCTTAAKNEDEVDPWITRERSAPVGDDLKDAEWKTEWSLNNLSNDLIWMTDLRRSRMQNDYREFIIIDRVAGAKFMILDDIAGILARLSGCRSVHEVFEKAVRQVYPIDEQESYLGKIPVSASTQECVQLPDLQYEGNRVRSWTVADTVLESLARANLSRPDVRLMRRIVDDMEVKGLVSSLARYQMPHTHPIVLPGQDGVQDIYFPYKQNEVAREALSKWSDASRGASQAAHTLGHYAERYRALYPNAIAVKGRLHTHYCAWPLSIRDLPNDRVATFRTVDGLLFRWNVLPFDWPFAAQVWQEHVDRNFNAVLTFAHCVGTTLVVCGSSVDNAEKNLASVHALADKLGWKMSIQPVHRWTSDLATLKLDQLWAGIAPDL